MDIPIILAAQGHNQNWRETKRAVLNDYNDVECRQKFRFPKVIINDIITTLHYDFSPLTARNNPINTETKVLISLRLLATGTFQGVIGDTSGISQSSTSRILSEFCRCFIQRYHHLIKWYGSKEEMTEVKRKYQQSWGVKGLLGLIDGTMIPIKGAIGDDEPALIAGKCHH
ncbi:putative nuclease HARBI1 [Hydra vulgaris]|uniref:putative nuclease HARBI1 n=1 Tax=Hydra vulgaris TaxID=6087 RepID=UPI0032EA8293